MAEKDAKVRLNLAASGFLAQLQQLSKASKEFELAVEGIGVGGEKAARKLGALGTAGKAGLGAFKSSLTEIGSSIKSTLTQVATLGGALSLAGSAHSAIEVTKTYKDLAFAIQAGTGTATTWQSVQQSIEGSAKRWKRGNGEMSESYKKLWDDIGDAKFAAAGIESVAKHATAGVGSVSALTTIVGQLKEKFDIPTEGIDDALAKLIAMGNKGGANVEELGEKIGILGASAKAAGIEGAGGLEKMVSLLNLADGVTGNFRKSLKAVTGITDTLADPDKLKAISKELKIGLVDKKTNKPFAHALEMILAKSGGKQEVLAKVFSGEELKLVTEFGKTYAKAFDSMKGDVKAKTNAGLEAFDAALKAAGASTLTAAQVDQQAKSRLTDSDRQVADAMNRLQVAFTKPEMVASLEKLAEVAPKVADALAKLLGFAVEHPKTAVGLAVGGKVAAAVLPAVGGSLLGSLGKKVLGAGAGSALAGGAGRALAMGARGVAVVGTAAGAATAAAALAAVAGLGAAGYAGYKLHQAAAPEGGIIPGLWRALTHGGQLGAHAVVSEEWKQRHRSGVNELLQTPASHGRNASGPHAKPEASVAEFVKSIKSGGTATERWTQSMARAATAADQFSAAMAKYDPPGSNGLPPNPGDMSGSSPK